MPTPSNPPEAESAEPLLAVRDDDTIGIPGGDTLNQAFGSKSDVFVQGLVGQIVNIASQGPKPDERAMTYVASMIAGIKPRDEAEAMMAAQMAAVHNASMTFARQLAHVTNIQQQDSAERAFNKLCRTYAAQLEALKRYRTGGQQKITVKHVTVNEGGQAIVGNVSHGGGQGGGKE
jgi:hypothetical protein